MPTERQGVQGVVLSEDVRTESFVRRLLEHLGYNKRKFRFETAPSGRGAAESWVRQQYPEKVKVLRSREFERRCLLAIRDGDRVGVATRKAELNQALQAKGMPLRRSDEHIATPVPTWSIENWLLDLLHEPGIDENQHAPGSGSQTWKQRFERDYGSNEKAALKQAAAEYCRPASSALELPSLKDGRQEIDRLD
ncbi:hypothetical protein DYH09_34360 [bacterium CPR1]|nr:hypothetical protein [bacterium CPR1]